MKSFAVEVEVERPGVNLVFLKFLFYFIKVDMFSFIKEIACSLEKKNGVKIVKIFLILIYKITKTNPESGSYVKLVKA